MNPTLAQETNAGSARSGGAEGAARPQAVRVVRAEWREAHEAAKEASEPVFVPHEIYADDRGWSLMNLLHGVLSAEGQINFSVQYPGVVKAWHRHRKQTDFWCCVHGNLKAGVYRESDRTAWSVVMGEKRPGVLIIPPTLWHGATAVGPDPAGLMYYMTHAFDPKNPDEDRLSWDGVPEFPWRPENR